ncbi:flagellar hook-basal body complex protein FliE [Rhizobium sp. SG_E_25_P2]|jgi:flagellar hook-basal body complex protein FliE|uniref:flagellar hook-basal body complex protein FliE n=1 Tax=Rhizobium sp. SG_E_25_P2 TaxID=2879942 RepID=UPI002473CD21|nr:flagellar hook-basal body complex protein FliE [Rhizobium sp. SG_E_25_P2]MDH6266444.1 flagellar hook-basal body complex protein FliE [Rhizobium sp. SG_E_25_P2]
MIEPISALSASLASETKKIADPSETLATMDAGAAGASFTDFVSNIGASFVDNLKAAETKSMDGMLGKASVREVVETVMTADQTLQTAMAFRDKVVSAYLDIVKMNI